MTTKQVAHLVDEAIELDRTIAALEADLNAKKERLKLEAREALRAELGEVDPHEKGCSYTFAGTDGCAATVSFPKPKLISGFWLQQESGFKKRGAETVDLGPVRAVAGEAFGKLFCTFYKPAKAFRELVGAMLSPAKAERLVGMMEEASGARVNFEVKAKG